MSKMLILALTLASSSAFAKWAPIQDTTSFTCQQARANVSRNGFQHYTVNGSRYRTFYANGNDRDVCAPNEELQQAWVRTSDTTLCPIGYECVMRGW